ESECPSQVGRLHTTRRGPRLDVRWARCRTSRHVRLRAALTAGCDGGKITVWMKGRRVRYAAVRTASFEETPCPAGLFPLQPGNLLPCGGVSVPEDGSAPTARRLMLAVTRLRTTSGTPGEYPVLVVNGGPGTATLGLVTQAFLPAFAAPLQSKRDLV